MAILTRFSQVAGWKNLDGRCLQRLEASETPLGAASGSPPPQSDQRRFFSRQDTRGNSRHPGRALHEIGYV